MIQNRDIVIFSTMQYHELPTRKQRIASLLCKSNRVLYIEPPSTYLSVIFQRKNNAPKPKSETPPNLRIATLPTIFPFGLRNSFFHHINQSTILKYVDRILTYNNFYPDILWFYLVDYPAIASLCPEAFIVYDCVDDHSAYPGLRSAPFVNTLEKKLVQSSDLVFSTTDALRQKLQSYGKNVFLIPNGVEYSLYQSWDQQIPKYLAGIPHPIIGYMGSLKEWFDVEFIFALTKAFPEYHFVLAGPCSPAFTSQFSHYPHIHFPGSIPPKEVPAWIGTFDVCLIPFLQNELTLNISPLKFFEYCAMSKPCVSIPIHQLEQYKNIVYLYHTHEEGIQMVQKALEENDIQRKEKRLQIAKAASWDEKLAFMLTQIEKKLLTRKSSP
jgi:hypothetical protein